MRVKTIFLFLRNSFYFFTSNFLPFFTCFPGFRIISSLIHATWQFLSFILLTIFFTSLLLRSTPSLWLIILCPRRQILFWLSLRKSGRWVPDIRIFFRLFHWNLGGFHIHIIMLLIIISLRRLILLDRWLLFIKR